MGCIINVMKSSEPKSGTDFARRINENLICYSACAFHLMKMHSKSNIQLTCVHNMSALIFSAPLSWAPLMLSDATLMRVMAPYPRGWGVALAERVRVRSLVRVPPAASLGV